MKLIFFILFTLTACEAIAVTAKGNSLKSNGSKVDSSGSDDGLESAVDEEELVQKQMKSLRKSNDTEEDTSESDDEEAHAVDNAKLYEYQSRTGKNSSSSNEKKKGGTIEGVGSDLSGLTKSLLGLKPNNYRRRIKGRAKIRLSVSDLIDNCVCPDKKSKRKNCCFKKNAIQRGRIGITFDVIKCKPFTPEGKPQNCLKLRRRAKGSRARKNAKRMD